MIRISVAGRCLRWLHQMLASFEREIDHLHPTCRGVVEEGFKLFGNRGI